MAAKKRKVDPDEKLHDDEEEEEVPEPESHDVDVTENEVEFQAFLDKMVPSAAEALKVTEGHKVMKEAADKAEWKRKEAVAFEAILKDVRSMVVGLVATVGNQSSTESYKKFDIRPYRAMFFYSEKEYYDKFIDCLRSILEKKKGYQVSLTSAWNDIPTAPFYAKISWARKEQV